MDEALRRTLAPMFAPPAAAVGPTFVSRALLEAARREGKDVDDWLARGIVAVSRPIPVRRA